MKQPHCANPLKSSSDTTIKAPMTSEINFCCCCGNDVANAGGMHFVKVDYIVPDFGIKKEFMAVVCWYCYRDSNTVTLSPVVEALINAKVIRFQYPDLLFTPKRD